MGTEKLDQRLEQVEIKQTRSKIDPIRFKDEASIKSNFSSGLEKFDIDKSKEN